MVTVRSMQIEDYDQVYALWMTIHGFSIRTIDDSREGVERFLKRNPGISVVAEMTAEWSARFYAGMTGAGAVCITSVCMRITGCMGSAGRWWCTV